MKKLSLKKQFVVKLNDWQSSQIRGGYDGNTSYVFCQPWCEITETCEPEVSKTVTWTNACPTDNSYVECYCTYFAC